MLQKRVTHRVSAGRDSNRDSKKSSPLKRATPTGTVATTASTTAGHRVRKRHLGIAAKTIAVMAARGVKTTAPGMMSTSDRETVDLHDQHLTVA